MTVPSPNKKPYRVQILKDKKGEWRWRLLATNGLIVATSGEGYKRRASCLKIVTKIWSTDWILVD